MSPRYSEDIDLVLFTPTQTGRSATDRVVRNLAREAAEAANPDPASHNLPSSGSVATVHVDVDGATDPLRIDVSTMAPLDHPDLAPHPIDNLAACSIMGRHATPAILAAHPELGGFTVPALQAHITAANKLSALHGLAAQNRLDRLHDRARDLYDLAMIAGNPRTARTVRRTVPLLAAHDAATARTRRGGPGRPEAGYATSPALTPGTAACEALEHGYNDMLDMVYGLRPDFQQALQAARTLDPPAPSTRPHPP